ncbi:MAG: DUF5063 domain-containing protein [Bacteroidetes bacterium]|nr:MAG: DUF5063 domain-containing protein [Bacteroidota bacterium]
MDSSTDQLYSRNVIEFVAVANEFCKYAEHASELKGDELLKIMQRILPLMYLKASLLPQLNPYFEDGNEKFVKEADWTVIQETLKEKFGTANDYLEVFDEKINDSEEPVLSGISENMADIYQDIKDFLLLYQTGTGEVMNDAIWECRMNFENFWGQKLVNSMRAIHKFIYSGEEIGKVENDTDEKDEKRNTSDWFISRRQKDFRGDGE